MGLSRIQAGKAKSTSTWTSRGIPAFAAISLLSACAGDFGVTRNAPERIIVPESQMIVAGPPGYCVDRSLSRDSGDHSFVMMGSCASISGRADRPAPDAPAVLTVAISPEIGGIVPVSALADYADSPQGQAALSRTGSSANFRILEKRTDDGVLFIHARDSADQALPAMTDTFWRALFPLNGRIVTASVVTLEARPISRDAAFATLQQLTERLLQENREPVVSSRGPIGG